MGLDPTVSGVISGKLILAAGFIQSTLWRGLAQCFDLDSNYAAFQGTWFHVDIMILSVSGKA